ncbi:hypothetical protein XENOCAPTIV_020059, partial [Xenoophorus captivus]
LDLTRRAQTWSDKQEVNTSSQGRLFEKFLNGSAGDPPPPPADTKSNQKLLFWTVPHVFIKPSSHRLHQVSDGGSEHVQTPLPSLLSLRYKKRSNLNVSVGPTNPKRRFTTQQVRNI